MKRLLFLLIPLLAAAQAPEPSPHSQVAKYLDQDGDFYLYWNSEKFGQELKTFLHVVSKSVAAFLDNKEYKAFADFQAEVAKHVAETGLAEIRGVGMSSTRLATDIHEQRTALYHGPEQLQGRLWQVIGGKPHPIDGLSLLPANTALATSGDFRLGAFWEWFGPEGNKLAVELNKALKDETGIDLGDMLASAGDQVTFLLTMNPENRRPVGELTVPELGFLVAVQTRDERVYSWFEETVKREDKRAQAVELDGARAVMIDEGWDGPMKAAWTWAQADGYLFFANSPDLIQASLDARKNGDGLVKTAEFATLSKGLPSEGNSISFVSAQLTQTLLELARGVADEDLKAKLGDAIEGYTPIQSYSINVHHDDAFVSYARSSSSLPMSVATLPTMAVVVMASIDKLEKAERKRKRLKAFATAKLNEWPLVTDDDKGLVRTEKFEFGHGYGASLGISDTVEKAERVFFHNGTIRLVENSELGLHVSWSKFSAGTGVIFWSITDKASQHEWTVNPNGSISPRKAPNLVVGWQEKLKLVKRGTASELRFPKAPRKGARQ